MEGTPVDIGSRTLKVFHGLFILSQVGVVSVQGLLIYFIVYDFGGFNSLESYHPFLGVLGLVILQGESIVLFRILRNLRKTVSKALHSALNFGALTCALVSVTIMFRHGFRLPSSIHGILGLLTVVLILAQYLIAALVFLTSVGKPSVRRMLHPVHIFIGMTAFVLSCGVCLLELAKFQSSAITRSFALSITFFAIFLAFVATYSPFRRRPLPEERQLPTNQS